MRPRSAFTLIELLVVMAIIAILAAILFPVFAQAKAAAKKSACLSNTKQQAIALSLYLQENDDVMPSAYETYADSEYHDIWNVLLPYAQTKDVFYCPERVQTGCTGSPGDPDPGRCIGYGYNWGPVQTFTPGDFEGGLLSTYDSGTDWEGAPGRNEGEIVEPDNTIAFADTHDRTWYTVSMNTGLSAWSGQSNRELVHGGKFNVNFVDGHSHMVQWRVGLVGGGHGPAVPYLFPRNAADDNKWCANPDELVNVPSGIHGGLQIACKEVPQHYRDLVSQWLPD